MAEQDTTPELTNNIPLDETTEEERLRALVDTLSGYIELYHGGAVEMVNYKGGILQVHMTGACEGCRLAPVTLHGWVEGTVKQFFPTVQRVESV
jgi:Fe-S cluster biogenesis protein NfuA